MHVNTEPAYILHKRPYRETSQILEVFSRNHGRLALISKGSRGPRSRSGGLLQPFRPLLLSWYGRGEMPSLRTVDVADGPPPELRGKALLSAMYLNELLMILLHRCDVHEVIFSEYHETLYALTRAPVLEVVLRYFEKKLLEQLGFGLNLVHDADSGESIEPDRFYAYHYEHGPVQCQPDQQQQKPVLSGRSLLAFYNNQLEAVDDISEVKRLMRYVITNHLGPRKLKSRELFRRPARDA